MAIGAFLGAVGALLVGPEPPSHFTATATLVGTPLDAESFQALVPSLGASDEVLIPMLSNTGMDLTPAQLAASGQLVFEGLEGGGGVQVIGSAENAAAAVQIANAGASSFASVTRATRLGDFTPLMAVSATEISEPRWAIVGWGAAAGAIIGAIVAIVISRAQGHPDELRTSGESVADGYSDKRIRSDVSVDGAG